MSYQDWLAHHGIKGQKWGKMQGPPYPLTDNQRSFEENRQNSTSPSAMALMRKGVSSRFNQPGATSGGSSGASGSSSKSENSSSTSEKESGKNYHDTLTRENRFAKLKAENPDAYSKKPTFSSSASKSSSKSGKSEAEKAAEKAAKEKAAAEKAEKQAREQWYKDGKKAVLSRIF